MRNKSFFDWSKRKVGVGFSYRGALTGIFLLCRSAALVITCNEGGYICNFTIEISWRPQFYIHFF